MGKFLFTESDIVKIVESAARKVIKESLDGSGLAKAFEGNKEWHRKNPTKSGSENPYPGEICHLFMAYCLKNYKVVVSYKHPSGRDVRFAADKDSLWDAIYHAYFDCTDLKGCFNTLEHWVRDYYEEGIFRDMENDDTVEADSDGYVGDLDLKIEFVKK